ncbi:MAG: cupin domain-containing protein, partial [Deltaproteobacteria bacterium]
MTDSTSRRTMMQTLLASLALSAAADAAPGAQVPTEVLSAAKAKVTPHPFGDQRVFFEGATDQLKSLTVGSIALKAGQEPHPPHQHPEEEILLITNGPGEIFLEGKTTPVNPGDIMYVAG